MNAVFYLSQLTDVELIPSLPACILICSTGKSKSREERSMVEDVTSEEWLLRA